jgi:putative ABC transport system substrate-binding protein
MKRREFITLVGGAAAWPLGARAQQQATLPVIGFLQSASADVNVHRLRAFLQGLKETDYVEGENVTIEYRWAEGQNDRMPALAADLVRRQVALITAFGSVAAIAAKAATKKIPIVFNVGDDPVRLGLVASLARPSENLTGVNFFTTEAAKRLELLRELLPTATRVSMLVNPTYPDTERAVREVAAAANSLGLQIQVFNASSSTEINAAFASLMRERPDALLVGSDPFLTSRRIQLMLLATRHAVPAIYETREAADVGGLMSYGTNITDAWRQVGGYAGRILNGAKPADLPVVQSTRFELVINHVTANVLGLTVPPSLIALADEVIE